MVTKIPMPIIQIIWETIKSKIMCKKDPIIHFFFGIKQKKYKNMYKKFFDSVGHGCSASPLIIAKQSLRLTTCRNIQTLINSPGRVKLLLL